MKQHYLLVLLLFVLGLVQAQIPDQPEPLSPGGKTNDAVKKNIFTDDPLFSIYFMGGTPSKSVSPIDSDYGKADMISYMYEKSFSEVYMVAHSTYPNFKNVNTQTFLNNAKNGFCSGLGLSTHDETNISIDGHPGIFFKASGGSGLYAAMVDYLVDNTLFQIGILRSDRAPTQKEINDFIYSFKLKSSKKTSSYFESDPAFRINFFGINPSKSVEPVSTDLGTINMTTYMIEKSDELVYMLALSDYPQQYVDNSNSNELLQNVKDGYLGNMGMLTESEKKVTIKGNPGLYFRASGDGLYTDVIDYLVGNRLYQIAILRTDRPSTQKEVQEFLYSFELK